MLSVYSGRACLGFVISRGKLGYEGFVGERSIGMFASEGAAATAILEAPEAA
jgi:hypothetical protein